MATLRDAKNLALYHAMGLLPTRMGGEIGARIAARTVPAKRKMAYARAAGNIARLRPDLDAPAQAAMLERSVANLGRYMAELTRLERLHPEGRVTIEGVEHFEPPWKRGQPIIAALLHMGNWEVVGSIGAHHGLPLAVVMQPPESAMAQMLMERMRAHSKVRMLPPGPASAIEALRILEQRSAVLGLFVDAQMIGGRVITPALGRAMPRRGHNMAHAIRMAARTGAIILPVFTERLDGPRYRVVVMPALELPRDGGEQAMLDAGLPMLNKLAEDWILPRLDQWHMLFRLGMGEEDDPGLAAASPR